MAREVSGAAEASTLSHRSSDIGPSDGPHGECTTEQHCVAERYAASLPAEPRRHQAPADRTPADRTPARGGSATDLHTGRLRGVLDAAYLTNLARGKRGKNRDTFQSSPHGSKHEAPMVPAILISRSWWARWPAVPLGR